MASATVADGDEKENFSEDDEPARASFKSKHADSSRDSYDSDNGDSDCSVTSGFNGHLHEEVGFFMDRQAGHSTADESEETTWTDEKHSSYLDSMEATFVQKMYDKEYCSLDVCGHSSHSSLTMDHECVESQPFCLSMRKPLERKMTGLLTFRDPVRPFSGVPSVLMSPWIQHFKSRRNLPLGHSRSQEKAAQSLHVPVSVKEVQSNASGAPAYSSLNEDALQSSHSPIYRKNDIARLTQVGECKRQKSQHLALSQLDIIMEQQYNLEQHRKMGVSKSSEENRHEEPKKNSATDHECKKEVVLSYKSVALREDNVLKEDHAQIESHPTIVNGLFSQKLDQVVPSFQGLCEESSVKTISGGDSGGENSCHTSMPELERVTARSGSKTWTWGIEGPKYRMVKQTSTPAFCP